MINPNYLNYITQVSRKKIIKKQINQNLNQKKNNPKKTQILL